jgi:O-antigen/teichoic acid export membrane protein
MVPGGMTIRLRHLVGAINTPRFLVLIANGVTRASGFTTSLLLARFSGAHKLGEYSILLNTAVSVMQPFVQVMSNNSTLLAVNAHRRDAPTVRRVALADLLLAVVLSIVSLLLFLPLERLALNSTHSGEYPAWLGFITASSVIAGQLCGAVLMGTYYGIGRFAESALVSVSVSIAVVVLAAPAILLWGLAGAYAALILASIAPPLALAYGMFRGYSLAVPHVLVDKDAVRTAVTQFQASLPSVAITAVGAAVSWVCTIYLVQRSFGIEGIGLVALGMQWLSLMMLVEGSWGGVSLKILAEAVNSEIPLAVRKATLGLLQQNVIVTLAVASIVVIGADWIASWYGLGSRDLKLLIRLNAGCAIVVTCNNIFQRLFLCLNRQKLWFLISSVRLLIQLAITVTFINSGLFVVVLGVLAGAIVQMFFCTLVFNRIVSEALGVPKENSACRRVVPSSPG